MYLLVMNLSAGDEFLELSVSEKFFISPLCLNTDSQLRIFLSAFYIKDVIPIFSAYIISGGKLNI